MANSTPGGSYRRGYDPIGLPGYLLTASAPAYGTADSNGYVGVSQDYNSHANAVDRPTSSSVKLSEDGSGDGSDGVESTESSFANDSSTNNYEDELRENGTAVEDVPEEQENLKVAAKDVGKRTDEDGDDDETVHNRSAVKKAAPVKRTGDSERKDS